MYENRHCGNGVPTMSMTPPAVTVPPLPVPTVVPVPTAVPPAVSGITQDLFDRIQNFVLPGGKAVAPPCELQGKFNEGGVSTQYPHVKAR